ncbi:MAG: ParB/RepB/Spo0J family partition protein [Deltaproteobacteria bacterium]|nr:MAG: ParB/RepB/Spo0J family partition protein [Deltaproteobacteria bacterium]
MNKKRSPLGKGLHALIPAHAQKQQQAGARVVRCPIGDIVPNSRQPRQSFDTDKLKQLADSVRSQGVLQPLLVRSTKDGKYQIIAGERRWRAAKMAGLQFVPVIVKDLSDAASVEVALIENIQREDLNPLEEAEAYRQLIEEHRLTQAKVAERVGKSRSHVTNLLRLLNLPPAVKKALLEGKLTMGHARALLAISDPNRQKAMADMIVARALSVRQVEQLAAGKKVTQKGASTGRSRKLTANEAALVESLQRSLGTKVELKKGRKGGKLVIEYYTLDQLDYVTGKILGR